MESKVFLWGCNSTEKRDVMKIIGLLRQKKKAKNCNWRQRFFGRVNIFLVLMNSGF